MDSWIALDRRERELLVKALREFNGAGSEKTGSIIAKLLHSEPHPKITVGVYGGQVQWILGNPFPVRICDYDGDREDLPDFDDRGQQCRTWLEPTDMSRVRI